MRTPAHMRRALQLMGEWAYASATRSCVRASWGIPAGGCVCPRILLCVVSRSGVPRQVPSWLVLLRIVRSCDFSGPADGRQLALKVPGLTIQTMVAQGFFCMSSRRQRWTFIPPKLWKLGVFPFGVFGARVVRVLFPCPGCFLLFSGVLCPFPFPWECRTVPERVASKADE